MDTYFTISETSKAILFKEKNSKFYAIATPVKTEEEIKLVLQSIKKEYSGASHFCYAYQLHPENPTHRVNDDGEPNNSAGMPIYGQIQSFQLIDILVVVIRFFGGAKLGIGGLILAYKTAAKMAIEDTTIIEKTINSNFKITFDYKNLSKILRILKDEKARIISQKLMATCEIIFEIRKKNAEKTVFIFSNFYEVTIQQLYYFDADKAR